jgi:proteic killer suppression protein
VNTDFSQAKAQKDAKASKCRVEEENGFSMHRLDTHIVAFSLAWRLGPDWAALTYNGRRYTLSVMIRTFRGKETEKVFQRTFSRTLPREIQQVAFRKLRMLNRALTLADLRVPPGNRLQMLRGDREGQYSIRINDRWRICFEWGEGDAFDGEITDYH